MINQDIFRSYDVRGVYPAEINEEAAEAVGAAAVEYLKAKQLVVGRDMRLSSPKLHKALVKGITQAGADVIDIGMAPTPVINFTVAKFGYDGGIMISASHNPPQYNGLKIVRRRAVQLSKGDGIEDVQKIALAGNFQPAKEFGRVIKKDIKKAYYTHILRLAKPTSRKLKIVVDAGNGMGGFFKPVLDKLNISYEAMYFKPDGTYPNHLANPAEHENLRDAIREVKKAKADFGAVFDGDADRAIFVDDSGAVVRPDYYTVLLAPEELRRHKDKRIYYDLRFSQVIIDKLKALGAKLERTRVGNPFYKQGLIGRGGTMAAELSGHIMFADGFGLDDGLLPIVKMVNYLGNHKEKLSELIEPLTKFYANPGEINVESKNSARVIEGLEREYGKLGKVDKLDGLTVQMKDWWFNVRGSNTEPVIRVNLETKPDQKFMESKKKELLDDIERLDI